MRYASDNANDYLMPVALTASKVGNASTRKQSRRISVAAFGASTDANLFSSYCEEDVRMSVLLLIEQLRGRRHLPAVKVDHVLHWSNYSAKAVAQIQARGMPIDMPLWNLVQENKTRRDPRATAAVRS